MQVTIREQLSVPTFAKPTSFGLVLVGPLSSVVRASAPTWKNATTFTIDADEEISDLTLKAVVWRTLLQISLYSTTNNLVTINADYDGPTDAQFHLMGVDSTGALAYSAPVVPLFGVDKIFGLELDAEPPVAGMTLHLVINKSGTFVPTVNLDGSYTVDWGTPVPFAPLAPTAIAIYRVHNTTTPCVRIYRETRHLYSNPVLDNLPDFDQLLFINTNGDTSGVLAHITPYDYYFVPTDEGAREVVKDLTEGREFFQTFELPHDFMFVPVASFVV